MTIIIISTLIFGIAYALKGGWGNKFKNWDTVRERNRFYDWVLDGKTLIAVISLVYFAIVTDLARYGFDAVVLTAALMLGVASSMGEEVGAIGTSKTWWGDYKDAVYPVGHQKYGQVVFGRSYGIKKGIQRGVFLMAPLALVTNCGWLLIAGLFFVPITFVLQDLKERITGVADWSWTEPAIGASMGIAIGVLVAAVSEGVRHGLLSF